MWSGLSVLGMGLGGAGLVEEMVSFGWISRVSVKSCSVFEDWASCS